MYAEYILACVQKIIPKVLVLRQNSPKYNWGQISPIFINKVLLEHSYLHLVIPYLWLFTYYKGRVEQLEQRTGPTKSKIFTIWASTEKGYQFLV